MSEYVPDRSVSWDVEEGIHEGTLIECGNYTQQSTNGNVEYFRLIFAIDAKHNEYFEFRCQKRYALGSEPGTPKDLQKDLERWLGREFFEENPNTSWNDLFGKKARLVIKHRHYSNFRKPFVVIQKILPCEKLSPRRNPIVPMISPEPLRDGDAAISDSDLKSAA